MLDGKRNHLLAHLESGHVEDHIGTDGFAQLGAARERAVQFKTVIGGDDFERERAHAPGCADDRNFDSHLTRLDQTREGVFRDIANRDDAEFALEKVGRKL